MKKLILFFIAVHFIHLSFGDLTEQESKDAYWGVKTCRCKIFCDRKEHNIVIIWGTLLREKNLIGKRNEWFYYRGRKTNLIQEFEILRKCLDFCAKDYDGHYISNFQELMRIAIALQNPEALRVALEEGADPNTKVEAPVIHRGPVSIFDKCCGYHSTWLTDYALSITEGNIQIMTLLLEHGADPNIICYSNQSLLTLAITRGQFDVVHLLLKHGAAPNLFPREKIPPLMEAMRINAPTSVIEDLVEHKADPNACYEGRSPIFFAIYHKNVASAKVLIEHKANLELRMKGGLTPFLFAVAQGQIDIARLLQENGANIFALDSRGFNCCEIARDTEIHELIESMVAQELFQLSLVLDPKVCVSTPEEKALVIEKLDKMAPDERELIIKLLLPLIKQIDVFPLKFITEDIICVWLVQKFELPLWMINPEFWEKIIEMLGNKDSILFMPEMYRAKVVIFIRKLIEAHRHDCKAEDKKPDVLKEDISATPDPVSPTRTQEKKQKAAQRKAKKAKICKPTKKKDKSVKALQQASWDIIFALIPGVESKRLDDGEDGLKIIVHLLEFLRPFGIYFTVENPDHYKFKVETIDPDWAKDFYRKIGFIPSIAETHNGHKVHTKHYEEIISYFFHYVFLLARNVPEACEPCRALLIESERHLKDHQEIIMQLYPDVIERLFPDKDFLRK